MNFKKKSIRPLITKAIIMITLIACGKDGGQHHQSYVEKLLHSNQNGNKIGLGFLEKNFKIDDVLELTASKMASEKKIHTIFSKNRYKDMLSLNQDLKKGNLDFGAIPFIDYVKNYPEYKDNFMIFFLGGFYPDNFNLASTVDISDIKAMAGKKISCVKNSGEHLLLRYLLKINNIREENIKWVFTSGKDKSFDMLTSEKSHLALINSNRLEGSNLKTVINSTNVFNLFPIVFIASKTNLKHKRKSIRTFVKNYILSSEKYYKANKESNIFIPVNYFDNLTFFDGGKYKRTNLYDLFTIYNRLLKGEKEPIRNSISDTEILSSLKYRFRRSKKRLYYYNIEKTSGNFVNLFSKKIYFPLNDGFPDQKGSTDMSKSAMVGTLFQNSEIRIKSFYPRDERAGGYLSTVRADSFITEITKKYNINPRRIVIEKPARFENSEKNIARPYLRVTYGLKKKWGK